MQNMQEFLQNLIDSVKKNNIGGLQQAYNELKKCVETHTKYKDLHPNFKLSVEKEIINNVHDLHFYNIDDMDDPIRLKLCDPQNESLTISEFLMEKYNTEVTTSDFKVVIYKFLELINTYIGIYNEVVKPESKLKLIELPSKPLGLIKLEKEVAMKKEAEEKALFELLIKEAAKKEEVVAKRTEITKQSYGASKQLLFTQDNQDLEKHKDQSKKQDPEKTKLINTDDQTEKNDNCCTLF